MLLIGWKFATSNQKHCNARLDRVNSNEHSFQFTLTGIKLKGYQKKQSWIFQKWPCTKLLCKILSIRGYPVLFFVKCDYFLWKLWLKFLHLFVICNCSFQVNFYVLLKAVFKYYCAWRMNNISTRKNFTRGLAHLHKHRSPEQEASGSSPS